jgi:hypothetical protein
LEENLSGKEIIESEMRNFREKFSSLLDENLQVKALTESAWKQFSKI